MSETVTVFMCACVCMYAAVPLPLILLDLRLSTTAKLLAVALPTAIHLIVGNFVEPKVCVWVGS